MGIVVLQHPTALVAAKVSRGCGNENQCRATVDASSISRETTAFMAGRMSMTDKRIFRLVHNQARILASECVKSAPNGYIVTIQEPTRTLDQNAALHAAISDIAKQVIWHGEKMDTEAWKRLLTASWARAVHEPVKMVPALDGNGFDVLYRRTSQMTKKEVSSLIDYLHAWGTDQGVRWSDILYHEED